MPISWIGLPFHTPAAHSFATVIIGVPLDILHRRFVALVGRVLDIGLEVAVPYWGRARFGESGGGAPQEWMMVSTAACPARAFAGKAARASGETMEVASRPSRVPLRASE